MNKELFEMLCNDASFKSESADELRRELELEMSKEAPDTSLIDEIVKSIMETENVPQINFDIDNEYKKIASRKRKRIRFSVMKKIIAAACVVLVISNVISYTVYGKDIFSAIVTRFSDSLNFDFRKEGDFSAVHTNEYDDYGIKKKFEEYGHYVEVPMYIPKGFEITNYREENTSKIDLSKGEQTICLSFQFFKSKEEVNRYFIQDDNTDYKEITINGHDGYYVTGDNADWITYRFDNTIAVYAFVNVDRSEIKKIIKSIR